MAHLLILIFLPILLVGTIAVLRARRVVVDQGAESVRPFHRYLIFLNLLGLVYFLAKYGLTNIPATDVPRIQVLAHMVAALGSFLGLAGSIYWLLRTGFAVRRRTGAAPVIRLYLAGAAVLGLSMLGGLGAILRGGSRQWLMTTNMAAALLAAGIGLTVAAILAWERDEETDPARRDAVRRLGLFLLFGYLLYLSSLLLPRPFHVPLTAASLLWLNGSALFWLRTGAAGFRPAASVAGVSEALDGLASAHAITKREREVLELLFQGKSYKEIEDALCISLGTVKNHAYNTYRKLGINSRAQLIHMVLERCATVRSGDSGAAASSPDA